MNSERERAKSLLLHYLSNAAHGRDPEEGADTISEVHEIVDEIVDAAVEEIRRQVPTATTDDAGEGRAEPGAVQVLLEALQDALDALIAAHTFAQRFGHHSEAGFYARRITCARAAIARATGEDA